MKKLLLISFLVLWAVNVYAEVNPVKWLCVSDEGQDGLIVAIDLDGMPIGFDINGAGMVYVCYENNICLLKSVDNMTAKLCYKTNIREWQSFQTIKNQYTTDINLLNEAYLEMGFPRLAESFICQEYFYDYCIGSIID